MATKKEPELLSAAGINLSHGNRALRSIKMAQPIHAECQYPHRRGWWNKCLADNHDPYHTEQIRLIETPVYEVDEEGDTVLTGTKTKQKVVKKLNLVQVPLEEGHNDGRGVDIFSRNKGFTELEKIGYEPLCQLHDCWLTATFTCEYGEYCSKEHARLIGAAVENMPLEVLQPRKRRAQLRSVELD